MKALLFGATGMVGQGVLRECLRDPAVERVTAVGRAATAVADPKLVEMHVADLTALADIESALVGYDACFFCVGVSSAGMSEARYTALTYDLTLSVARTLARLNPTMTFVYVSGLGTDSTERGRRMWARVKGRTENALLALPFKAAYTMRPGIIIPGPGIRSRTTWYRLLYAITAPLAPALERMFPQSITTSAQLGRAMLAVVKTAFPRSVLETRDINSL